MKRVLLLGLAPVLALSCSSVSPVRVNAGDQCFRCRRTIGDTKVAGEILNGPMATKYRGPGCLAKYLAAHPDETGVLLVTDFGSGKMIPPAKAVFVPVVVDPNTGETDYRAYRVRADADIAARELHTAPIGWNAVLDQAR
jgi:hypothetical protein